MNNKFLSIAASTAIVASALVFTGCGDSDSSSAPAATTTTTTSSTSLTATAIKGAWSGLNYTVTANGTATNSTATMTSGKVNFNKADNVTIDLGLAKWRLNGLTSNNSILSFNQAGTDGVTSLLSKTEGTLTTAQANAAKANLLAVIAMMNNNTATVETAGFNAASMIAALKTLANQGLDVTDTSSASFIAALNANFSTSAMSTKNVTSAADAVNTYGPALSRAVNTTFGNAVASSTASASNSLNTSMLNGTFVYLKNGTGTYVLNAATGTMNTWANLSNVNSSGPWAANGSIVKIGGTNTSDLAKDYLVFGSAIDTSGASATPVTYVDNTGASYSYTLSGIKANVTNMTSGTRTGYTTTNLTLTSLGSTVLTVNLNKSGSESGVGRAAIRYANGTYVGLADGSQQTAGSYNVSNDSYGLPTILALYSDNNSGTGFLNLSFDFNPANTTYANGGVVATILNAVDSWITSMKTFLLSLFQA